LSRTGKIKIDHATGIATAEEMEALRHDGWRRVAQGRTTIEEVVRVTQTDEVMAETEEGRAGGEALVSRRADRGSLDPNHPNEIAIPLPRLQCLLFACPCQLSLIRMVEPLALATSIIVSFSLTSNARSNIFVCRCRTQL
jgi:hypothetical protein